MTVHNRCLHCNDPIGYNEERGQWTHYRDDVPGAYWVFCYSDSLPKHTDSTEAYLATPKTEHKFDFSPEERDMLNGMALEMSYLATLIDPVFDILEAKLARLRAEADYYGLPMYSLRAQWRQRKVIKELRRREIELGGDGK